MFMKMPAAAQEAERSFKLAEAFRAPPGAVAPALWLQSSASDFYVWGTIGGQTVFAQRPGKLILKKEQL
jgi:hypothetical protein